MSTNSDAELLALHRKALDDYFTEDDLMEHEWQERADLFAVRAVAAAAWDEALSALVAAFPSCGPCPIPEDCANPTCKMLAKVAELGNPYRDANALVTEERTEK